MAQEESLDSVKQKDDNKSIGESRKHMAQDVLVPIPAPLRYLQRVLCPAASSSASKAAFAEWAGSLLTFDKPMILVTEPGKEEESIIRLSRVGFDKMQGFRKAVSKPGRAAGEAAVDMIIDVEADELAMDIPHDPNLLVVDVRRETEYADGHIKNAQLLR